MSEYTEDNHCGTWILDKALEEAKRELCKLGLEYCGVEDYFADYAVVQLWIEVRDPDYLEEGIFTWFMEYSTERFVYTPLPVVVEDLTYLEELPF